MKHFRLLVGLLCFTSITSNLFSQTYCIPPPFVSGPYTGITIVKLSNLVNNSSFSDGVTFYESVAPAILARGTEYELSVTTEHHLIGGFSGNLNTYAWIDWNQDGDFSDESETVYKIDDKFMGEFTLKFTVPFNAKLGTTRFRIYNDMPTYEGHEQPHPCGYAEYPANAIGHHGEAEDYLVDVQPSTTGAAEQSFFNDDVKLLRSGSSLSLQFSLLTNKEVSIAIFNVLGQSIYQNTKYFSIGENSVDLSQIDHANQVLIVQLNTVNQVINKKLYSPTN